MLHFLVPLLLITACQSRPAKPPLTSIELPGRDEKGEDGGSLRHAVYRAKVPAGWKQILLEADESIADTTKPNATFLIGDQIVVTLHTFPTEGLEERIPAAAQVSRWKRQLQDEQPVIEAVSRGGFAGLYFEGKGTLKGEKKAVLGWSMQLDAELYQNLAFLAATSFEREFYKQMSADFTIKAVGDPDLIEKHREEICAFAQSFELIQEIPVLL